MREKVAKQLCGRDFDIVKEGLDPYQVEEFVTELSGERDQLVQRQEHLNSLTRLAERSVAEADALAREIKKEAEDEAHKQSSAILAKAEKEAQELAERKKGEILTAANKEAQAIKDNAQQEVARLISQQQEKLQSALRESVTSLHDQLLSGLKGITEQAGSLQTEWQNRITEVFNETPEPVTGEQSSPAGTEPAVNAQPEAEVSAPEVQEPEQTTAQKEKNTDAEEDQGYRQDILAQIEQAWMASENQEQTGSATAEATAETDQQEDTPVKEQVSKPEETAATGNNYQGTVHLDIMPPLTPSQLVEIQKYLRAWPGIGITELSPHNKGYSITVMLHKPMQLIDILKQLPEVDEAQEYTPEDGDYDSPAKEGEKRIRITVCNNKK